MKENQTLKPIIIIFFDISIRYSNSAIEFKYQSLQRHTQKFSKVEAFQSSSTRGLNFFRKNLEGGLKASLRQYSRHWLHGFDIFFKIADKPVFASIPARFASLILCLTFLYPVFVNLLMLGQKQHKCKVVGRCGFYTPSFRYGTIIYAEDWVSGSCSGECLIIMIYY